MATKVTSWGRMQIKPNVHCLPRGAFNRFKRKGLLPGHCSCKELFRDVIAAVNIMIYTVTECQIQKNEVFGCMVQYQNHKFYT